MESSTQIIQNNDSVGIKISIDMTRRALDEQGKSIDSLKSTARTLFALTNIVVTLLGAIQIFDIATESYYIVFYIALIIFYMVQMGLCISLLIPTPVKGPMEPNWQKFDEIFFLKPEEEVLKMQLSAYLNAYESNKPIIIKMRSKSRWASMLMALVILLMLIVSIFPI